MLLVGLLFTPAMIHNREADPKEVGKAIYVYLMLTVGVIMIVSGVLPLLVSFFSLSRLQPVVYGIIGMLIIGGSLIVFLLSSRMCSQFDARAATVPRAIYFCMFYLIGALFSTVGILYFLASAMFRLEIGQVYQPVSWWVLPLSLFFIGGGVLLSFRFAGEGKFESLCKPVA